MQTKKKLSSRKGKKNRQEEANRLVRKSNAINSIIKIKSVSTPLNDIPKVSEVYNATSSIMEIMDGKGRAVITLKPYERREMNQDERINVEKLEHFKALNKRNLVRFF